LRIVFLGSGAFAVPSLEALLDAGHDLACVVTQPDRRKGRGQSLGSPPVKLVAQERRIPLLQPHRVREPDAQAALRDLAPDLQVVVAYGQILPRSVIDIPRLGTVNVHASLLPRFRGAAPIQWAIARGEVETGVSTMQIDEGLDTGPVLLQRADLEPRLARLGAQVLLETVRGLEAGELRPTPQDHERATLAPLLKKEDGRLDWSCRAQELDCRIRGFQPWPGSFFPLEGRGTVKVLAARALEGEASDERAPGRLLDVGAEGLEVACGAGSRLLITRVQPESRRPMSAAAFAAGARLRPGLHLG